MARHLASSFVIAARRYGLVMALGALWAGCVAQSYAYQPRGGAARELPPVQRSRTTYSSSYNSLTHSSTSTPHTEYYTDYQSSYECRSVPVSRMRSEMVTETSCSSELQSRMVTRYEFQLENRYVPGHFETFTRQRLRELEPVCYAREAASEPAVPQNRIEGMLFGGG